ncbi:MIZ zinc finger domain protein, partial [Aspergillus brunneoviolaceus CBS 621.78]
LKKLDAFASHPGRNTSASVTLENARLRLLHDALSCQDLIYLVIHQLYTLVSYAPAELGQLQGFSEDQLTGLKTLEQLLVDNARLSPHFLQWAACFPEPISIMLHLPWWTAALSRAMTALAMLGHRWNAFEAHIRERGLPPLIEELVQNFALRSHVLHHTIFLALTRRISGPNKREERLSEIFRHDAALTEVRLAEVMKRSVPISRARKETDAILTLYHINMGYPPPHTPPSVFGPQPVIASAPPQAGQPIHSARTPGVLSLPTPPLAGHSPQFTQASPVSAAPAPVLHPHTPNLTPTMAHMSVTVPSPGFIPSPTVTPGQGPGHPRRPSVQAEAAQQAILAMRQTSRPGALRPTPSKPSTSTLLLPASGKKMPANAPPLHPLRDALHQVDLREPVHQLVRRDSTGQAQETKLFQYLDSFALMPRPLGRFECQFHWSFTLSQEAADRLPAPSQKSSGELSHPVRVLMDGQQLYRMRCISVSPDTKPPIDESTWSRAACAWPSVIYIFVNDTELFVRRKLHHQKDVPLDITPHLRAGENRISMHFIRDAAEQKDKLYAAAVEIAQIAALEPVMALAQTLQADNSRRQIHQRLEQSSRNENEDDDLHVVSSDLMINLVDPFTAHVFKQPVRGQLCLHSECFDHETFIQTRAGVSGPRALPNDWRCPICQGDARPQMLVRDEFMVDVHKELVRTNQLDDARAIRVALDGSWTV